MEPFSINIKEFCKRHNRDLQYSCMSQSPIPFENPSVSSSMCFATGPSPPFGAAPDRFQVDEGGRSFTPSPCVGDSVMLGRDWPGLYTEAHTYGSTPWNSEPVCVTQGGLVQYGNSGTVHHYGTPQNFQSLQRNSSCSSMQYGTHFLGDLDLCEEQDCQVTSSTEVSPWKPLSHMPEMLNSMVPQYSGPLTWQSDGLNVPDERNVASHMTASNAPGVRVPKGETVAAQTPWKLKKHKRHLSLQNAARTNSVQKIGQNSQTRNTLSYDRQKALQRKREHAIRDEVYKLCALLPWQERDRPPSKNEILHKAISYIGTLECKVGKICQEMGIMWPSCKLDMPQEFPPKAPKELAKLKEDAKDFSATKEELGATSEPAATELDCLRNIFNSHTNIDNCNLSPQKELGDSRVKRPMNAFLIFSKKNRKKYQDKYPGRDNRKITTLMAEDWNRMREAEKKPFKDEADEEMRKKKENPRFKYCIQAKKIPQVVVCSTAKNGGDGFRVGNHILRARKREGSVDTKSAKCVKVEGATD